MYTQGQQVVCHTKKTQGIGTYIAQHETAKGKFHEVEMNETKLKIKLRDKQISAA